MNESFDSLMRDVARTVQSEARRRDILPEVERRLAAMDVSPRPAPSRTIWRIGFAGVALAAAGAVAFFFTRPQPLSYAVAGAAGARAGAIGDAVVGSTAGELALRFSDGSEVTVPERARAHVDALDPRGAIVAVDEGTVEVSVVHRDRTRWTVRAGRYQIHVTGTRFAAGWDPRKQALTVTMHEGSVAVTGPGLKEPMRVVTGQRLRANVGASADAQAQEALVSIEDADAPVVEAPAPHAEAESAQAPAAAAVVTKPAAPAEAPARETRASASSRSRRPPAAPQVVARAETGWRALASASRYDDALSAALREGWSADCDRLGVEDLILLGDVARLARDFTHAEEAYQAARRRFPTADRPLYQLGRIAFEGRHDYAAAARHFDAYVRAFPHGALVREAAGRLLEARIKAGDIGGAREAATSYLNAYPDGPHAALARRTISSEP